MNNSNQFNNTRLDLAKKYPDQSRQDKINLTVSNVNYRSICQFHTSTNLITYLRVHGIFPFIPIPWFLLVATIILIFILILGPNPSKSKSNTIYDGYFIFTIFVFSKQVWRSGPGPMGVFKTSLAHRVPTFIQSSGLAFLIYSNVEVHGFGVREGQVLLNF